MTVCNVPEMKTTRLTFTY